MLPAFFAGPAGGALAVFHSGDALTYVAPDAAGFLREWTTSKEQFAARYPDPTVPGRDAVELDRWARVAATHGAEARARRWLSELSTPCATPYSIRVEFYEESEMAAKQEQDAARAAREAEKAEKAKAKELAAKAKEKERAAAEKAKAKEQAAKEKARAAAEKAKAKEQAAAERAKAKDERAKAKEANGEPRVKISDIICEGLLAGRSTDEILADVHARVPTAETKSANVSWYRSKMYREGTLEKARAAR